ncbi:MAG: peroxiredoxin [Bacteroidota bacterium]
MNKPLIGEEAPDFELLNHKGEAVKLSDYRNKRAVVLYFYPKDETPGCIKEACGFRDQYEAFTEAGAEVIGVSGDSVESHNLFQLSRMLPFQLLSDPKNRVRKVYGVSGSFLGLVPGRETFVIDKKGMVKMRFASQFQVESHIEEALKVVKELANPPAAS